ncbi:MAG: DNA polymerase I [Bacilli bacterium]|nr:DNA polymerase I [Bacilli bacterium]
MNKVILIDGNNLLFRSYYATAYNGNFMKNSKNFPTNALFGFVNMINKIITEEQPIYVVVAFDKGKTFRHEKYDWYKDGRIETPIELKQQFPIAKQILTAMGIKYLEIDNYEADDIIGTIAKMVDDNDSFIGTIVSSDKDLLQLISNDVDVKLLKQKDYIRMNENVFIDTYGIKPIRMIDLKALEGDPSDNIPGVKGVGEKTALTLLKEYDTIENIYENIENIKGKLKEKLINDKEMAFTSKEIATICKDVPLNITFEDIKLNNPNDDELFKIYEELEFYSFIKKHKDNKINVEESKNDIKIINDINEININGECAIYLEIDNENYHTANIYGMGVYNKEISYYIPFEVLKQNPKFLVDNIKYTYDLKKVITSLRWHNIDVSNIVFDTMIAAYLLNYNIKDDISYLAGIKGYDIEFYDSFKKDKEKTPEKLAKVCIEKAKFIYETKDEFYNSLVKEEVLELFNNIEMPLAFVLSDMEYNGVHVDKNVLDEMGIKIQERIFEIQNTIYELCGMEFNISSPRQLGEVLFEKLGLKGGKKIKSGYSTNASVLEKIINDHPVIEKILEYRTLTKLYSTYIEGLKHNILSDGKIHTIYTQTLTRTGRLSSIEPNLQNIPIRYEEGRLIRKAFIPSESSILMSSDYSQIELRILAHMSNSQNLIDAFIKDLDIHTKTASDIFGVPLEEVTKDMRRTAKAVNFGIVYGISSFGLSENLSINPKEASEFINKYLDTFPGIKEYMESVKSFAYSNGYVKTLMNRKRVIDELTNTNYIIRQQGERIALNTPIQGTSADIIKKAMIDVYNNLKNNNLKSKMILQVHDELIVDCLKEEKEIVKKIVRNSMENVIRLNAPLKVEIESGDNWYDAK